MTARTALARSGEQIAARFLISRGWRILDRNARYGRNGEIDIVAERDGVLAFVEVKTRRADVFGTPGEAVTARKRSRIRTLARMWLMHNRPAGERRFDVIRFDVVEVRGAGSSFRINHLEGAF